jgi:hypothetical protein
MFKTMCEVRFSNKEGYAILRKIEKDPEEQQ